MTKSHTKYIGLIAVVGLIFILTIYSVGRKDLFKDDIATGLANTQPSTLAATSTQILLPPLSVTASQIPSITSSRLNFPELLINIGEAYPLRACRKGEFSSAYSLGRVMLARYSYDQVNELLSDKDTGFYSPIWSPDGKWIAYITLVPKVSQSYVLTGGTGIRTEFNGSDSIWLMRPDGTEKHRIGDALARSEIQLPKSSCNATGGIFSLNGWSSNGQWISFQYAPVPAPSTLGSESNLYAINIASGETQLLAKSISYLSSRWSPKSARLAVIPFGDRQVDVISVEPTNAKPLTFSVPISQPDTTELKDIRWSYDEKSLIAVTENQRLNYSPQTIWRINIETGQWTLLATLDGISILGIYGETILVCNSKSILAINLSAIEQKMLTPIPEELRCTDNFFDDGNGGLSFFLTDVPQNIWMFNLKSNSLQKVIKRETLMITDRLEIAYISLHP